MNLAYQDSMLLADRDLVNSCSKCFRLLITDLITDVLAHRSRRVVSTWLRHSPALIQQSPLEWPITVSLTAPYYGRRIRNSAVPL